MSEWMCSRRFEKVALIAATLHAPFMKRRDRTLAQVIAHTMQGYVGEVHYAHVNGWLKWLKQRLSVMGVPDNGIDMPNGKQVKTIVTGSRFVIDSDGRRIARDYVVEEWDENAHLVRTLGTLLASDFGWHELPNGKLVWSCPVEKVRPI